MTTINVAIQSGSKTEQQAVPVEQSSPAGLICVVSSVLLSIISNPNDETLESTTAQRNRKAVDCEPTEASNHGLGSQNPTNDKKESDENDDHIADDRSTTDGGETSDDDETLSVIFSDGGSFLAEEQLSPKPQNWTRVGRRLAQVFAEEIKADEKKIEEEKKKIQPWTQPLKERPLRSSSSKKTKKKRVRFAGDSDTLDSPPPSSVWHFDPNDPPSSDSGISSSEDEDAEQKGLRRTSPFVSLVHGNGRPTFLRASREARVQQARRDAVEIMGMSFDDDGEPRESAAAVSAAPEGSAAPCRMLVMLKSLRQPVVFWEAEEKRTEEKFRLLGLAPEAMQAIDALIHQADVRMKIGTQDLANFREAFDQMSAARRWLRMESLREE